MRPMEQMELPQPGDVVAGKYQVERFLGRGGMGAVYVVSHRLTGKRLALKCLLPEHAEHADIVERFLREAQAAGRIQHRYVVDVFDVGRDGNMLYIVMEMLEGKAFSELLHDEALTLEETLLILLRSMEGVAAAHAVGIVHRDLKPDNIFICEGPSGRLDDPRVLDFGISKVDDDAGRSLTRSGVAMGTPYYMSLEQMSGQRDLDVRVDVYAMGVILYEAVAGQPPHVADSVSALAIKMLTTPPIDLQQIRPDLPTGLSEVVMKAIARDRDQRYPTMQALIDAVRPYVPKGAGLMIPEGTGRPLRTPRSNSNASPPRGLSPAAATTTPSGSGAAGGDWSGKIIGVEATLAAPITPSAAVPAQSQAGTPTVAPKRNVPALALVSVAAVVVVLFSVWWFGVRSPGGGGPPALPAAPPVAAQALPTPEAPAKPSSLPPSTATGVTTPEPGKTATPENTAAQVDVSKTGGEAAAHPGAGRKHGPHHTAQTGETKTPATGETTPQRTQVKGRAGELGAEEF